jgi:RHS repeat-associated protein
LFGLGWNADVPAIQRRTDKQLPQYRDSEASDIFTLSGAEDLVPIPPAVNADPAITRYRPRIEGAFSKIERINAAGNIYWKVTSKDNIVSVFGQSDDAKLFSPIPGEANKIFKWCLEYSYDNKGNFTSYFYKKENTDNIKSSLSEKNRLNTNAPFTNIYLKGVRYANTVAWYEGDAPPADFLFEMVFDFGEEGVETGWPVRKDPFSSYRCGFEIRTNRLCRRVLLFHHIREQLSPDNYLVRSLDLQYDERPDLTYLTGITLTGYIWNADGTLASKRTMPPLSFSYQEPVFSNTVEAIDPENAANCPAGVDGRGYQWTDLYSEGLPGILTEQADGWFYKANSGGGHFSIAQPVSVKPSFTGLNGGSLSLQDLEADGRKFLVSLDPAVKGYFEFSAGGEWQPFFPFDRFPNIDPGDPNLKWLDIDGNGLPDLLFSREDDFIWSVSKGKAGFDDLQIAAKANDEEKGPTIVFADQDEKMLIALADMSGDGLQDIVVLSYSAVYYYPNLGYGHFGAKVAMPLDSPFDGFADFDPALLHLADIDGTGATDIVYTGKDSIAVYFNQSGNQLSAPFLFFNPFPPAGRQSSITFTDLLGNGNSCLVWSSSLPGDSTAPIRYIDLLSGKKPHVMTGYKNNLGKETAFAYTPSTQFYLDDKQKGRQWITRLAFPVQCVSQVVVKDNISQTRFTQSYTYHHGYYDAREREFRGFAMVEQTDTEEYEKDLFQPAVITRTWFHTGAYIGRGDLFHQLQNEYYPIAQIPQLPMPAGISGGELAEACRALKGLPLRKEVYSDEGTAQQQVLPYSIVQTNYTVQCLQRKGDGSYGVFLAHEAETMTMQMERDPLDPRIAHTLNIEIDAYGNVIRSAAVVYGRKQGDAGLPNDADRKKQSQQQISYAMNGFTTVVDNAQAYKLPLPCSNETWELSTAGPDGGAVFFTVDTVAKRFNDATPTPAETAPAIEQKRMIGQQVTLYQKDDLSGPEALGSRGALGFVFQQYQLVFTPGLLSSIYGDKLDGQYLRDNGLYESFNGDGNFWSKSGRSYYHPDLSGNPFTKKIDPPTPADITFAKTNFYLPVAYEDNAGYLTKVFYDPKRLILNRVIDPLDNEVLGVALNYRTITICRIRDANDNQSGIRQDALGLVTHSFQMGKSTEFKGDLMDPATVELSAGDQPTTTMEYAFDYFDSGGVRPNRVKTATREKHYYKTIQPGGGGAPEVENDPQWQLSYSYSDGSGHEVLKKIQAEPGDAPLRDGQGKLILDQQGQVQIASTGQTLRWIGNGRTIFNNKGNPVKQYDPFFDSVPDHNDESELVLLGHTPVLYYDALDRLLKTVYPDGSFSKVEFGTWMQRSFDRNDTVLDAECRWYLDRINGQKGGAEQMAAQKTAVHTNTPSVAHFDSMGRIFLTIINNTAQRSQEALQTAVLITRNYLDTKGDVQKITQVSNAAEREIMSWKYDLASNICYQHSTDAGERWIARDVLQKPLRLWDSRAQVATYTYDRLHRISTLSITDATGEKQVEKFGYGEELADVNAAKSRNCRGRLFQQFDTAGVINYVQYDFKGNLLENNRQLLKDFTAIPNWTAAPELDEQLFVSKTDYDALNRVTQNSTPDQSIHLPGYNKTGQLTTIGIRIKGAGAATPFVLHIDYDAKGQRKKIDYGNNTTTAYEYNPETVRLQQLVTINKADNTVLQDLQFTYDPMGNITRQSDNAQKTIFYGGQRVAAQNNYTYDALYQLIEAEGREHSGQMVLGAADNFNDGWSRQQLQPNSPVQLRNYAEKYFYDEAGNITRMRHIAGPAPEAGWTRDYQYNPASNQLTGTILGNDVPSSQNYGYTYNPHGSMLTLPHLQQELGWNFREELQHVPLGGGGEAWYVYDSNGQRIRKVVQKPQQREERIYIGGYEIFRVFDNANIKTLERETLQVMDDTRRIAQIDTRTAGDDGSPAQLIRYQYSDHLGSACLELDDTAKIVSYEEYHPFGTTAYQATDASRQVPAKRYRYTGMERDEETGFGYHSARYYIPWLGRWSAADPSGLKDGTNIYAYVSNRPIVLTDVNGREGGPYDKSHLLGDYQLHLDPKISAMMRDMQLKGQLPPGPPLDNAIPPPPDSLAGISGKGAYTVPPLLDQKTLDSIINPPLAPPPIAPYLPGGLTIPPPPASSGPSFSFPKLSKEWGPPQNRLKLDLTDPSLSYTHIEAGESTKLSAGTSVSLETKGHGVTSKFDVDYSGTVSVEETVRLSPDFKYGLKGNTKGEFQLSLIYRNAPELPFPQEVETGVGQVRTGVNAALQHGTHIADAIDDPNVKAIGDGVKPLAKLVPKADPDADPDPKPAAKGEKPKSPPYKPSGRFDITGAPVTVPNPTGAPQNGYQVTGKLTFFF